MPDLTKTDKTGTSASQLMREIVKEATAYQAGRLEIWREGLDAWQAQGYVADATAVTVKVNRVMEAVESSLPRHASALWPQRPYIPIRSRRAEYSATARHKTRVIDGQVNSARFLGTNTRVLKMCQLYGNAGVEVDWDVWVENVEDSNIELDPVTGQVVDISKDAYATQKDGLRLRAHTPWSIGWARAGSTPLEKPWMYTKSVIPAEEVERLIDLGKWKLPKDESADDFKKGLREGPADGEDSAGIINHWRSDLSGFSDNTKEGLVVMIRLYSVGRWITWLNYRYIMADTENQNTNMDRRVKPVAWMTIDPFPGDDSFYGNGDWEKIRDLAMLDDDLLSIYIDSKLQENLRWFVYDPKHVDEQDLKVSHGGTIPIMNGSLIDNNFDRAFRILDPPARDSGLLELHGVLGDAIDRRKGSTDVMRGIAPSPKQTLGATTQLMEAAATRLGFQTRYIENTFMYDLANLISKTCAANMSLIQMVDSGGISYEEAIEIVTPDPEGMPGGFEWEFEGSERVARRQQKSEKLRAFWDVASQHPLISEGPGAALILRAMAEDTEKFEEDKLDEMFQKQPSVEPVAPMGGEQLESAPTVMPPNQMSTPAQNAQGRQEVAA